MTFNKSTDESADCSTATDTNSDADTDTETPNEKPTAAALENRSKTTSPSEMAGLETAAMTAKHITLDQSDWDELDKALVKVSVMAFAAVVYWQSYPNVDGQTWALILVLVGFVTGETVKRRL